MIDCVTYPQLNNIHTRIWSRRDASGITTTSGRNVHDAAIASCVGPTQRGETSTSYDAGVKKKNKKKKKKKKNFINPNGNTFEYKVWCFHSRRKKQQQIKLQLSM